MELCFQTWTEVWSGRGEGLRSRKRMRIKVPNAAKILNKVRPGKSTDWVQELL